MCNKFVLKGNTLPPRFCFLLTWRRKSFIIIIIIMTPSSQGKSQKQETATTNWESNIRNKYQNIKIRNNMYLCMWCSEFHLSALTADQWPPPAAMTKNSSTHRSSCPTRQAGVLWISIFRRIKRSGGEEVELHPHKPASNSPAVIVVYLLSHTLLCCVMWSTHIVVLVVLCLPSGGELFSEDQNQLSRLFFRVTLSR